MKLSNAFLIAGVLSVVSLAEAKVPYAQLEKLRQQSVVVRVILDNPTSKEAQMCKVEKATLGSNLEMKMDAASEEWGKVTIGPADIKEISEKVEACAARGSCQVYDEFLGTAKSEDSVKAKVKELKETLDNKLEKLTAADYLKALATVPFPCGALK